ncbi:uncharacterized protein LDX57_013036 [Aspergillus melleus]|uniref:uncharacterized protein n=1 Tax=Aspergillus melleus TaxID=138277 RepID=UPI001E8E12F2|nr:uncharacterized protein LDX57_013036 [Aspergillus melleus]KAH8435406.1 hypothetical protein LDX57_013036 [Aspergillus melleus]
MRQMLLEQANHPDRLGIARMPLRNCTQERGIVNHSMRHRGFLVQTALNCLELSLKKSNASLTCPIVQPGCRGFCDRTTTVLSQPSRASGTPPVLVAAFGQ